MCVEHSLVVPGEFEYLAKIADFIDQVGREAGFDEDVIFHVQMAVDEACSNIIEHAYGLEKRGDIFLHCRCQDGEWVVTLKDHGQAFDPAEVPTPKLGTDLDEIQAGGLGLYFMHQLMDEVHFTFDRELGNELRMVKREA